MHSGTHGVHTGVCGLIVLPLKGLIIKACCLKRRALVVQSSCESESVVSDWLFKVSATSLKPGNKTSHAHQVGTNTRPGTEVIFTLI